MGKLPCPNVKSKKHLAFVFSGAKIDVLGFNDSVKSPCTVLKIMAGLDTNILREAVAMPNLNIGYLPPGSAHWNVNPNDALY